MRVVRHQSELGDWEAVFRPADPRLRGHVVSAYQGWTSWTKGTFRMKEVPIAEIPLILNLGPPWGIVDPADERRPPESRDSFVAGLHDTYAVVESGPESACLEVRLSPLAAHRILGAPMDALANRAVELEDALGPAASLLTRQLRDTSSWEARFELLDRFLARRLLDARPLSADVVRAWQRLQETAGRVEIGALAGELGCSRRHLALQFRRQIGLPPKTIARILRFNRALRLLRREPEQRWAEIAHDCGYYDQAHFNRDFREFAGATPTEFLAQGLPSGAVAA